MLSSCSLILAFLQFLLFLLLDVAVVGDCHICHDSSLVPFVQHHNVACLHHPEPGSLTGSQHGRCPPLLGERPSSTLELPASCTSVLTLHLRLLIIRLVKLGLMFWTRFCCLFVRFAHRGGTSVGRCFPHSIWMLTKVKKVTKQIGESTVQRHDAGSLDSGVCLGAARSYSPKSELETLYRYENISSGQMCFYLYLLYIKYGFRVCYLKSFK